MSWHYGDWAYGCRMIPSLTICNLFARQLLDNGISEQQIFAPYDRFTAGVGVQSACQIPSIKADGSLGNIANIIICGLSFFAALGLASMAWRRSAAVARGEFGSLLVVYALTCVLQLIDSGALLNQATTAIVAITAVHAGLVALLFWILLWIAFLNLQVVEDGKFLSWLILVVPGAVLLGATTYIGLDTGIGVTRYFQTSIEQLRSAWLFSLTALWPAVAVALFYLITMVVIVRVLKERKPIVLFSATFFVFILSQGARYALSHTICTGSNQKVDGSFVATLLETATVGLLFWAWKSITEEYWEETASSSAYGLYN